MMVYDFVRHRGEVYAVEMLPNGHIERAVGPLTESQRDGLPVPLTARARTYLATIIARRDPAAARNTASALMAELRPRGTHRAS